MRYAKILAALAAAVCLTACGNNGAPAETVQTAEITNAENTETTGCPFGDISGDKLRLTVQAYVPNLFEPDGDMTEEIAAAFNSSVWEETDINAMPELSGEIYHVYVYNGGQPFGLFFYWDGTVEYRQNDAVKKYKVYGDAYSTVVDAAYGGDPDNLEGLTGHLVWCEPENLTPEGVWLDVQ
ncbi:MAG: hypothetical protein NC253_12515 [Ruminococcus sp.]|nr:hypothetical protein [Ruminococcus sp.]MCM1382026.1 hypothetical protein [Muribaculaceae bacterium]MCM1480903.1 hypothetical protein [Muribaculaceae bacterium]